jgi:hypothetical protein
MSFGTGSIEALSAYHPVVGGVEHLTWHKRRPPAGTIVQLLCGELYQVTERRNPTWDTGCLACDREFRRYFGPPDRGDTLLPTPRRAALSRFSAGVGAPDPAPAGHHLRVVS